MGYHREPVSCRTSGCFERSKIWLDPGSAPDLLDGLVRGGRLLLLLHLLHLLLVNRRLLRVGGMVHGLIHEKATILCSFHQSDW
jgi:hypothetical protein